MEGGSFVINDKGFYMRFLIGLAILMIGTGGGLTSGFAQSPTVRSASSTKVSGMIRHLPQEAQKNDIIHHFYTLAPEGATCISLDFSCFTPHLGLPWLQVFAGTDTSGKKLCDLGREDTVMALNEDTVTLVFSETPRTGPFALVTGLEKQCNWKL